MNQIPQGLRRLKHEEGRFEVERHHLVEKGFVHLAQRLARDHAAREVDEDVERVL